MPEASASPVLAIRGLSVRLPASAERPFAVEDVSLDVHRHEIVCVVGESGSGKSVTAFTVMGLLARHALTPVAGQVLLQGEDLLAKTPAELRTLRARKMSMIFQEPMTALNPVMTVGDQVEEVLSIHATLPQGEGRRRVVEIMRAVRLPEPERMLSTYPHQLSGGQRQRIMIAMALVLEPALLIADEPTTALDVTTQAEILRLIKDIQREHATGVLFITHDFGVVSEIADRVVVMQKGRVVEQGPAAQILRRPEHPYTRMLMGAVPSLTPRHRDPIVAAPVVLAAKDLDKTYDSKGFFTRRRVVHAVKGVTFDIRRGETLGIVGESGSGKSTVARCIVRLVDPSGGSIDVAGHEFALEPAALLRRHRRKVQIVFQDPYRSLNPRRSVGLSIIEGPMNFGLSRADAVKRAQDLLQLVGLDPRAFERFPSEFSGGQRQRICIARALAMEPELLVADEPVSALDVSVQAQVLDLLEDVRKRFNLAMLFITHDLRVAAQVCDRVAVMHKGEIVEQGRAVELFAAPQHAYTKSLLDAAPGRGMTFGG